MKLFLINIPYGKIKAISTNWYLYVSIGIGMYLLRPSTACRN